MPAALHNSLRPGWAAYEQKQPAPERPQGSPQDVGASEQRRTGDGRAAWRRRRFNNNQGCATRPQINQDPAAWMRHRPPTPGTASTRSGPPTLGGAPEREVAPILDQLSRLDVFGPIVDSADDVQDETAVGGPAPDAGRAPSGSRNAESERRRAPRSQDDGELFHGTDRDQAACSGHSRCPERSCARATGGSDRISAVAGRAIPTDEAGNRVPAKRQHDAAG